MSTTNQKGFGLSLDNERNIVKFRMWGFWGIGYAEDYRKQLKYQLRELDAGGKNWHLLLDLTDFPPQTVPIQQVIGEGLLLVEGLHIIKRAVLVNGAIPQFWIDKPPQKSHGGVYSYFRSETDAIHWLENEMNS